MMKSDRGKSPSESTRHRLQKVRETKYSREGYRREDRTEASKAAQAFRKEPLNKEIIWHLLHKQPSTPASWVAKRLKLKNKNKVQFMAQVVDSLKAITDLESVKRFGFQFTPEVCMAIKDMAQDIINGKMTPTEEKKLKAWRAFEEKTKITKRQKQSALVKKKLAEKKKKKPVSRRMRK